MNRTWAGAAVVALAWAVMTACASGQGEAEPSSKQAAGARSDELVSDTSARGRVAFGCAFERGFEHASGTGRHYAHRATHALFVAALESKHDYVAAARLWNASDAVIQDDRGRARTDFLDVCTAYGFDQTAGLPELRTYMCAVTRELASKRPDLDSFGPEGSQHSPGDPLRTDVSFVSEAQTLLAVEIDHDPRWYMQGELAHALSADDRGSYSAQLRQLEESCAA